VSSFIIGQIITEYKVILLIQHINKTLIMIFQRRKKLQQSFFIHIEQQLSGYVPAIGTDVTSAVYQHFVITLIHCCSAMIIGNIVL